MQGATVCAQTALPIPVSVHGMTMNMLVVISPVTVFYPTLLDQFKAGLNIMESLDWFG